jgi:predicted transcriptional regulator
MINVALSDQVAKKLQAAARQRQVDPSALMEDALDAFLAGEPEDEAEVVASRSSKAVEPAPGAAGATTDSEAWDQRQRQAIAGETQAYLRQHAALLAQYHGRYIAMLEGKVVDDDADEVALSRRVRARYGKQPVLITPVLREPIQSVTVHSPRLMMGRRR